MNRIDAKFAALKEEGRSALVTFITAGDPNYDTSLDVLKSLPGAGADIIEIGVPFTDPAADGPAIQAAGLRALKGGMSVKKCLQMVREFRKTDSTTPIVLMGYYNPIFIYGVEAFAKDAAEAGVDGLITVDIPPEEDAELRVPASAQGIHTIRLTTPVTTKERFQVVKQNAGGFLYYVSITGITGAAAPDFDEVAAKVAEVKEDCDLPVAVGFGITNGQQAGKFAGIAEAVVVGTALIRQIEKNIGEDGQISDTVVADVAALVEDLAAGVKAAAK